MKNDMGYVCVCVGGGGGGAETDGQNISLKQGGDRHGLGVHLTKKLNDKSSNFSVSSQSHWITSGQSNSVISKCLLQSQSLHFKVSPYTCIYITKHSYTNTKHPHTISNNKSI